MPNVENHKSSSVRILVMQKNSAQISHIRFLHKNQEKTDVSYIIIVPEQ